MNFKSLVLAAALLPAAFGAYAADYTAPTVALSGGPVQWSVNFGTTHDAGAFTDTYTFTYSGAPADAIGFFGNLDNTLSNIDFTSASLNGDAIGVYNLGPVSGALVLGSVDGLVTLVIKGVATGSAASYAGTLDLVSAVPEPSTYGMLLGGLGVLGFLARRRKQK